MSDEQTSAVRRRETIIAGHRMSYLEAGPADGAPMVLVHGLLSDATTWTRALPGLAAQGLHVIAPDLLGHGESDKPAGAQYSLEGFAATVTALMDRLDLDRVTMGGHSLGGGTAIAMSYLHPERVRDLVLVASGGFGTDLHPVLRGATLPGVRPLLRFAFRPRVSRVLANEQLHRTIRLRPEAVENLARMGRGISTEDGREAFFATLRENIDRGGQRGSMVEMGFVNPDLPTLLVWSERDPIIPESHAEVARRFLQHAQLVTVPGVSHEPHRRHPERFVSAVAEFLGNDPAATPDARAGSSTA
ncbi:MAG: alpha/beta fold hydrolase [Jatrophihabitans sp.]